MSNLKSKSDFFLFVFLCPVNQTAQHWSVWWWWWWWHALLPWQCATWLLEQGKWQFSWQWDGKQITLVLCSTHLEPDISESHSGCGSMSVFICNNFTAAVLCCKFLQNIMSICPPVHKKCILVKALACFFNLKQLLLLLQLYICLNNTFEVELPVSGYTLQFKSLGQ